MTTTVIPTRNTDSQIEIQEQSYGILVTIRNLKENTTRTAMIDRHTARELASILHQASSRPPTRPDR
jgi:hypothetical protein